MRRADRANEESNVCEDLAAEVARVYAAVIPSDRPVAIFDWPNYDNAGDHLIYLGERALLRAQGLDLVYDCEKAGYSAHALRRYAGRRPTILFHGGGNFGDEYPSFQAAREQVMSDFPRAHVVQLPQTLHFTSEDSLRRTRASIARHEDFTLLCRDRTSLVTAVQQLGARAILCPDSALALRPERIVALPQRDVLWLSRSDAERRAPKLRDGSDAVDWLSAATRGEPGFSRSYSRLVYVATRGGRWVTRSPHRPRVATRLASELHIRMSQARMRGAVEIIGSASVVVTDRLHAHILCLLLGRPHVVVDTGYGKIRWFMDTWSSGRAGVRTAIDSAAAAGVASELLGEVRSSAMLTAMQSTGEGPAARE